MDKKPTIKKILKANLKYIISILCAIFATIISIIWNWGANTFNDILGFVLIVPFLLIAVIFTTK